MAGDSQLKFPRGLLKVGSNASEVSDHASCTHLIQSLNQSIFAALQHDTDSVAVCALIEGYNVSHIFWKRIDKRSITSAQEISCLLLLALN